MTQVEVRIPTFCRPNLLRRAIASLLAQTHKDWICRVLDDSPTGDAASLCMQFVDTRIRYEPNPRNLGISENLDRSFSLKPVHGSRFVCVLEDDNYYLPENLEENIKELDAHNKDIILRNQLVEKLTERDAPGTLTANDIYSGQYLDGVLLHGSLLASFFYSTGANNSSLFWRADANLNFSTKKYLSDVVSQERLRTLCIDRDVVVGMRPLIVWRDNGDESLRPKLDSSIKWRISQLIAAADERAIYKALHVYLGHLGLEELAFQPPACSFSAKHERVFLRAGVPVPRRYRTMKRLPRLVIALKRIAAQVLVRPFYTPRELRIDLSRNRLS